MQSLKDSFAESADWGEIAARATASNGNEWWRLITPQELDDKPKLARGLLLVPVLSGWLPALNTCRSEGDLIELLCPNGSLLHPSHPASVTTCQEILFRWIYAQPAIKNKDAHPLMLQALCDDDDPDYVDADPVTMWDEMILFLWAGKAGRPVSLRHAAIEALFLRVQLGKPWEQIIRRVCPCSKNHTPEMIKLTCQPKLETEVRILKRLLKDAKITLPLERMVYIKP